ncbi:tRNA (adenosine(37)-N6)-threonylcarbamoyltransferase complex dimerization subunit type 1 TsaB [Staphylococcus simulans]|uniref:tRNA (adenosine(37)-N6)-threonylcarbamoyltransferase complex dimerization subunit type 1 TsaB n=1 Tax=Staphylococcus simulans TaxID=1286 RepID=UPI0027F9AE65|nr:tRNA (adenosine(37)-N6)-threonylcarbamoyltransferase complex dimerization subunit type 1 TsaB [Staphylococcus simulans]MDQ7112071.1 tRNA (adenosine(37)-N6)-threonylcarbamoyltransferase complex dimerization subunit type 1 TsaB [Staphylococcus simulans]MDQ7118290.1 tRNA (adenosine(37)-N6)-threonylcarbamoyltransferase complex dimerization subunit type 1 TsaB [Staphylococcus simulans]WMM10488.1 tRNA (adenosine(37)-N6)-threonylcarbamoyltransferase complex dimerization subunit type 1 TsaB [Staphylo
MIYLLLDTSNKPMSLAVMQDENILVEHTTNIKRNHSVQLMPAIQKIIEEAGITKRDINAIIVAKGPGSYTGLRIGVTTAKTLAYALNTELYGVSSLEALAATLPDTQTEQLIVPVFDARREAVYTGVYQYQEGQLVNLLEDQYMLITDLNNYLNQQQQPHVFVGHDLENITELLNGPIIHQLPNASVMQSLITQPENIHTFKPDYLKLSEAERNWLKTQQN